MKATQIMGGDNVIYTYLPISYDTIQSTPGFPITIAPNVVLEIPDKSTSFTNVQENVILTDDVANNTPIENTNMMSSEDIEMSGTTTACIINQESILNKTESSKSKENLICDTCNKEFDKVSSYKKHLLIHRNVKKFKCEHCFESYNIEDNYKLHMALHGQNQPTCPLCKRQFQRLASLKSHLMMHQVEETFVCRECLAEFEKEDEYNKHMESHSIARLNVFENIPYICSYCNYLFEDPKDYKEHVSYHIKIKKLVYNPKRTRRRTTNNKEYSHRCSVCNKSFPKNCLLERHMRIHNGEKPYACPKCDKAFAQKGTLQIHLVKHSGHKPYKCTLCPAEYFQKGNLRVHVEKTHTAPPNIDKMYKCTQCTCIFRKIASLNAHITKAHGDMKHIDELTDINDTVKALREMAEQFPNPSKENIVAAGNTKIDVLNAEPNETFVKLAENSADGTLRRYVVKQRKVGDTKWFICLYCSKEFKKPSDLIRHIRIHTREKPYKCKTCNQAFALKSTLLSHLNTHDGKREYQCLICFKYFTSARTLSVHTKKHGKSGSATSLKYKCSTCKKLFGTMAKVRSHMEVHNCNNEDDIEKESRSEDQENLVALKQPMVETDKGLMSVPAPKPRIPHAEMEEYKNRPYKCHKCDAAFTKPTHVKRHMLRHSGERNFKCDLCAKTFFTSYALKEHLRFHNPEKKFACTLCPQKFVAKELLKRHQIKHSSVRPYICPYCKRRFKTAPLCRKHINTHGSDTNLLNSELEMTTNSNPAKMIDLSDTIRDNPFDLDTQIDEDDVFYSAGNTQSDLRQDITSPLRNINEKRSTKSKGKSKKSKYKTQSKRKVTDSNASYNHDVLNLPTNAQIFVSKEGFYTIIMPEGNESETAAINVNVGSIDQGPAAFISYDEYPTVGHDVYNTILSNVKLQNSDPILMSTIGESQDSNILFMDPTLPQSSEFQSETQNFEPFNPAIFNASVDLNLGVQSAVANANVLTPNNQTSSTRTEQSIKSAQMKLGFANNSGNVSSKKVASIDNSKLLLAPENVTLNDNLIITLNEDEFASMNFGLNNGSNSTNDNLNLNIMDSYVCMLCRSTFNTGHDLEKHQCVGVISAELDNDDGVEKGLNAIGLDENLHDIHQNEQITLITDYNDQLQTAHIEISTDEPTSDSPILRETLTGDDFDETDSKFKVDKPKKFENKCTYCGKSFKKASDLIRHVRTHTGEKPFSCNKCNKSFSLKSTLQSHQRTHSNTRNKDFICSVCNCNFSCRSTLKIHMRIHTGVKPYACHICHMKFRTSSSRKSHLATHAKESRRNEFKNANQINRCLEGLMPNQAKIDDSNLATENIENNEMQHIEGLPIDLLQQLQNAGLLLQETGGDILSDGLMQFNYDTATILNPKTMKTVPIQDVLNVADDADFPVVALEENGNQASKKFECNYCQKTYTTKAVLRKHQKRHKKDFQCPNCDKQFDSQHVLDKHVKLHSGYRPFSCTNCANSFSEERSLKTHMKRIHNVPT